MSDIVINPPRRTPPVVVEADAPAQVTTTVARGRQGEPGQGVPAGGAAGQVLSKASGADYATEWVDPSASVAWGDVTGTPTTLAGYGITDAATAAQGVLAGTALQPALIGVTVQGYSAVLAGTTASFTTADEAKLDGIAAGATANATDAALRDRATHTGTQTASTISDFNATSRAQTEAAIIAGTNITITTAGSGATRTLTIAAAGGSGSTQVYVQDTDPGMTGPGIWIQTGLAPSGTGFTFWFEDGL